jgi:carbonic anhydrase
MLYQQIDQNLSDRQAWSLRRQLGIPNNRRLWVLACMDGEHLTFAKIGVIEGK